MAAVGCSRRVGLVAVAALIAVRLAAGERLPAYRLEERRFHGTERVPDVIARIYVSGDWHRIETYADGKPIGIEISRPDRNAVYTIRVPDRTYLEQSFAELKAKGWSPLGHRALEEYEEKARRGEWVLTPLGPETVDGQACQKYSIAYARALPTPPPFLFWVSVETGFAVRQSLPGIHIEWSRPIIGPQDAELFERPRGYRKVAAAP